MYIMHSMKKTFNHSDFVIQTIWRRLFIKMHIIYVLYYNFVFNRKKHHHKSNGEIAFSACDYNISSRSLYLYVWQRFVWVKSIEIVLDTRHYFWMQMNHPVLKMYCNFLILFAKYALRFIAVLLRKFLFCVHESPHALRSDDENIMLFNGLSSPPKQKNHYSWQILTFELIISHWNLLVLLSAKKSQTPCW